MKVKKAAAILVSAALVSTASVSVAGVLTTGNVISVSAAASLQKDATGSEVTQLQDKLIALEYLKSGSATGAFDDATENAVKNFQSDYNLIADGIAGTRTIGLIDNLLKGTATVVQVKPNVLNMRAGAGTGTQLITVVNGGQKFVYSNVKTDSTGVKWYQITSGSKTGYVSGKYVTLITKAGNGTAVAANTISGTLKVTGTILNVRSDTSTSAQKLATVNQGQTFTYTDKKNANGTDWYYIKVSDSVSGWVMGTFVSTGSDNASANTSSTNGIIKVTGTILNVRASTSTSSKKITTVKLGQTYYFTNKKTVNGVNWYYIKVNSSKKGWVLGTFVSVISGNSTTLQATSGTLKVSGTTLNVRSDTSTSSKKLATVKQGQSFAFSNVKNVGGTTWYYIKVSDSVSGWVMGTFITVVKTDAPTSSTTAASQTDASATTTTAAPSENSGTLKIATASLNVRSDTSTSSEKLTIVKEGQSYAYSNVKDVSGQKWYFIKVSDTVSGWVMGQYVTVETTAPTTTTTASATTATVADSSTATTTTSAAPAASTGTLKVTATLLNVRADATTNSDKVTVVKQGESYPYSDVRETNGQKWYFINVNNSASGWVMGAYVTTGSDDTPASAINGTLTVVGTNVNVRSGAGTSFEKITMVQKEQSYTFSEVKDGWYHIKLSDTQNGWIIGTYVSAQAAPAEAATTTTAETTTTTTTAIAETTASTTTETTTTATTTAATTETSDASSTVTSVTPDASQTQATESTTSTSETSQTQASETSATTTTTTQAAPVTRSVLTGTVKISSGALNVRKSASTSAEVIGTLKKDAKVVIASKGSSWHKIEYGTGYGYVSAKYITNIQNTTENVLISYANAYNYTTVGGTVDLGLTSAGSEPVTYSSSDPAKCPVTNKGVVTCHSEGLYTITAKCGNSVTTTCVVAIKEPYADIQPMHISEAGTKFITEWEGGGTVLASGEVRYYPYQDVSDFWTIGYGHAKTSTASKSWSEERAIAELNKDIETLIGAEYMLTDDHPYLTQEAANKLLNADLNDGSYVKSVSDWAIRNGVKLTQTQFDALVSFCYNLGTSYWESDSYKFYLKSAIIAHRSGSDANPDQIIDGFCRYMKSSGSAYKGLWYRRRNEAELFLTGDYALDRENKFTLPADVDWAQ